MAKSTVSRSQPSWAILFMCRVRDSGSCALWVQKYSISAMRPRLARRERVAEPQRIWDRTLVTRRTRSVAFVTPEPDEPVETVTVDDLPVGCAPRPLLQVVHLRRDGKTSGAG